MSSSVRRSLFCGSLAGILLVSSSNSAVAQTNNNNNRMIDPDTLKRLVALVPSLKKSLESGNSDSQKATLNLLIDLPNFEDPEKISEILLAFLVQQKQNPKADPEIVSLGLKAWAKNNNSAADIPKGLDLFQDSTNPQVEQAVADASFELVSNSLLFGKPSDGKRVFSVTAGQTLGSLGKTIASSRPDTVTRGLKSLQIIATELNQAVQFQLNPPSGFDSSATLKADRLKPLSPILDKPMPDLSKVLANPDANIRLLGAQVFTRFALARDTIIKYGAPNQVSQSKLFDVAGFKPMIDPLVALISDREQSIRLAAVEGLEALGTGYNPNLLIPAANDQNLYVRWAAIRALGRLGPKSGDSKRGDEVVRALAKFANDPDVDVRSAALLSLQQHGKECNLASTEILKAMSTGDVECRIIALRAVVLGEIDPAISIPAIIPALTEDIRLARAAAVALGRYGVKAKEALPNLRKALQSSDQDLRLAAGEAMLLIDGPAANTPKKPKDD